MTRKSSWLTRLLVVGPPVLWAALNLAGCGGSSPSTPAANTGTVKASAAATVSPAPSPSTPVVARVGSRPDPSLPKDCLVSVKEAEALTGLHGMQYVPGQPGSCLITVGDGAGVNTLRTPSVSFSNPHVVAVPAGAPFTKAVSYHVPDHGVAAALTKSGMWDVVAVTNPNLSNQQMWSAALKGIMNVMTWKIPSHSPAPAPSAPVSSAPAQSGGTCYDQVWGDNPPGAKLDLSKIESAWALVATSTGDTATVESEARIMLSDVTAAHGLTLSACPQDVANQYRIILAHFQKAAQLLVNGGLANIDSSRNEQDKGSAIEENFGMGIQPS